MLEAHDSSLSVRMSYFIRHTEIRIQSGRVWLDAVLSHAPDVRGLIIEAQPCLSQLSSSPAFHATSLIREAGFASLLVNMLTAQELMDDEDCAYDIALLSARLQSVLDWVAQQPQLSQLPLGLLASDTVAAAAVRTLVRFPQRVAALCIRDGRADLAGADPLRQLQTPCLLQVHADSPLRVPSSQAYALMTATRAWQDLADKAQHSALAEATHSSRDWFLQHLPKPATQDPQA
jgi:putative phosphoribosyl transferase